MLDSTVVELNSPLSCKMEHTLALFCCSLFVLWPKQPGLCVASMQWQGRNFIGNALRIASLLISCHVSRLEDQDLPWTDCALFRQVLMRLRYKSSFAPVLPGLKFVLVPWAGALHGWMSYMEQHLKTRAPEDDGLFQERALASCFFTVSLRH